MNAEYLNDNVADLSVERAVRKAKRLAESAITLVENRQYRLHALQHLFTPNGRTRSNAVEEWRACTWSSCTSTKAQVDAMRAELAELA